MRAVKIVFCVCSELAVAIACKKNQCASCEDWTHDPWLTCSSRIRDQCSTTELKRLDFEMSSISSSAEREPYTHIATNTTACILVVVISLWMCACVCLSYISKELNQQNLLVTLLWHLACVHRTEVKRLNFFLLKLFLL